MIKMDSVHDPNGTYPAARILAAARCRSRTRTVIKMESVRDANESLRAIFKAGPGSSTNMLSRERITRAKKMMTPFVLRRKKAQVPRGADERDRARFAKAQSYMVRRDDQLACVNVRCRKRFEVAGIQTVAFLA